MIDGILGALILLASILVIRKLYRDKRAGKTGCGGSCEGCLGCRGCGTRTDKNEQEKGGINRS